MKAAVLHVAAGLLLTSLSPSVRGRPTNGQQPEEDKSLCYAFVRRGDLWTVCQGKRNRIHIDRNVFDFAYSAATSSVAFLIDRPELRRRQYSAELRSDLILVDLPRQKQSVSRTVEFRLLLATCGTIVGFEAGARVYPPTDLISGKPLEFPSQKHFRCSSDRRVVVGYDKWNGTEETKLMVTVDGKPIEPVSANLLNLEDFDISPNGKYVAFTHIKGGELVFCVSEVGRIAECGTAGSADEAFVSDLGEVIYATNWDEDCGGPRPRPCGGIEYWRPGMPASEIVERDGAHSPQWITPEVAAALHQWNTSRSAKRSSP